MPSPTRKRELGRGERVAPRRLAAAPAAAVAGRAALQRLGGRRGRRHRAVRHRHARAGLARAPRARARPGQPAPRARPAASSARTRTPTTTARPATIVDRAGCELWMHPNHEHMTRAAQDPDAALRAPHRGRAPERRARGAAARATREARRGQGFGIAGLVEPDRDLLPGVEIETDLGHLDGLRDARPRAVARLPVPARAPPADLRRPPARPRLALLRLRLHARPGRRVPALARRRRAARRAPVPAGPRPHVHRRAGATSRPTARSCTSASARCSTSSSRAAPITAFDAVPHVYGEAITPMNANWWLSETLCYLTHLEARRAAPSASPDEPERWR